MSDGFLSVQAWSTALDPSPEGLRPIPSNRDIDEVSFLSNRQMKAEQRKLPGESKYPIVS
jgi:hypothetical protein